MNDINPPFDWTILHNRILLDQYMGLLVEMNAASKSIIYRYEVVQQRGGDGAIDTAARMKRFALEGVGTALIISTAKMIKEFDLNSHKKIFQLDSSISQWCDLVMACSNFVRHSDEWGKLYDEYCWDNKIEPFVPMPVSGDKSDFLTYLKSTKNKRPYDNLLTMQSAGWSVELTVKSDSWSLAAKLQLDDVKSSMTKMETILNIRKRNAAPFYNPQPDPFIAQRDPFGRGK